MKSKWIDLAIAWKNKDEKGEFITIRLIEFLEPGTNLYLRPNRFKNHNPKAPDYKYSVPENLYYRGEVLGRPPTEEEKRRRDKEVESDYGDDVPF